MKIVKIIVWVILLSVLSFLLVVYMNATKYEALVQVINENRVGVNPTAEKLDFGDLQRNKDAVRTVVLQSAGSRASYVIIWKRGDIADFLKISKNRFTLDPGQTQALEFSVTIPDSAEYRYYNGKVTIFRIPKFWSKKVNVN